jgi:hypothetical protein
MQFCEQLDLPLCQEFKVFVFFARFGGDAMILKPALKYLRLNVEYSIALFKRVALTHVWASSA